MRRLTCWGLLLAVGIILTGCGSSGKRVRQEIQTTSTEIRQAFQSVMDQVETVGQKTAGLYADSATFDLSTEGMDIFAGGIYDGRDSLGYYRARPSGDFMIAATGNPPVNETTRREIRLLERLEEDLPGRRNTSMWIGAAWILTALGNTAVTPAQDAYAMFPPGTSLTDTSWFQAAGPGGNPARKAICSPVFREGGAAAPHITISCPVYWDDAMCAAVIFLLDIERLNKLLVEPKKAMVFLMDPGTLVVGASAELAKKLPQIRPLPNGSPELDSFRLAGQAEPWLRELGGRVRAGETGFTIAAGKKQYLVVAENVQAAGYFLAGLIRR